MYVKRFCLVFWVSFFVVGLFLYLEFVGDRGKGDGSLIVDSGVFFFNRRVVTYGFVDYFIERFVNLGFFFSFERIDRGFLFIILLLKG